MKFRVAKKMASRYLKEPKGKYLPFGTYSDSWTCYNDGSPAVIKTMAVFPEKVIREIYKRSGNFCHWDDPLLLSIDDSELRQYEDEYHPPHTW